MLPLAETYHIYMNNKYVFQSLLPAKVCELLPQPPDRPWAHPYVLDYGRTSPPSVDKE